MQELDELKKYADTFIDYLRENPYKSGLIVLVLLLWQITGVVGEVWPF